MLEDITKRSGPRARGNRIRQVALRCGVLLLFAASPAWTASPNAEANAISVEHVELNGHTVHYLAAGPKTGQPVLLLHGARYHSGTWKDLGTLEKMADAGFRALAIDLPGFGKSSSWEVDSKAFLGELIDALKIARPVVIAPSMSGKFAFPLVANSPEEIVGFVPISAVGTPRYTRRIKDNPVSVLVVWGTGDHMYKTQEHRALAARFKTSQLLMLHRSGHAAYLDETIRFHDVLMGYLAGLDG